MGRPREDINARFEAFYSVMENGCWNWNGHTDKDGYGTFWVADQNKSVKAHRWSYERKNGPIQQGMTIDHICREKSCVNPDHLEAVTNKENIKRAKTAITHCRNGHELSGNNLYIRPDGDRGCRPCRLASAKRYLERKKLRIVAERKET